MRTKTQQELIDIIRFEIRGIPLPDDFSVSEEESLIDLAKKHDLTHLVYDTLNKNGIGCVSSFAMQQYYASIWRAEQMTHELNTIAEYFEHKGIDFIPLKGAIMRLFYPAPWMRTSADIDILFREDDFESVCLSMKEDLGYSTDPEESSSHHLSFYSPASNVHIEIHRTLFTDFQIEQDVIDLIPLIWEQAHAKQEHKHYLFMSDSCFYFYHIAHMVKHLSSNGGCPIRSLIDLWLLDNLSGRNETGRQFLLEKAGFLTFARMMSDTAKAWFEGSSVPSEELEQFILTGHMYGTLKNRVSIGVNTNGILKYAFNRVFLPYDTLKYSYPVLQKRKWLTPLFQVIRWTNIFKKTYRERLVYRLKSLFHLNRKELNQFSLLSQVLGIKNNDKGT